MGVAFSQIFPPQPNWTERDLPSQQGKVFIVTGGTSGIGYELASILFQAGAKVYIAGRSETRVQAAIEKIKSLSKGASTAGDLQYLHLELDDLGSIKASAEAFKARESKLDVLFNNAGVSLPPAGSVSKQGYELQLATNCLGPLLFTQMLLPCLQTAAKTAPRDSVRIIWTSSQVVDLIAPTGGIAMSEIENSSTDQTKNYVISKTGNWFLASEMARKVEIHGILSLTQNPGSLKTNLLRHQSWVYRLAVSPLLHNPKMGAYTELYAGLSPEVTAQVNGGYLIPWGRVHPAPRGDLLLALKSVEEGGTGQAADFQGWCEKQIADYR